MVRFISYFNALVVLIIVLMGVAYSAQAQDGARGGLKGVIIKKMIERRMEKKLEERKNPKTAEEGFYNHGAGRSETETLGDRSYIAYKPKMLPAQGHIPLLIVLHGGFGNAAHIQNYIGLDALADQYGFMVAYLNGTQVAAGLPAKMRGWNAGDCCGQPQIKGIDDIGFIAAVIDSMAQKYGIDPQQVYGTGHSNGGMMTQRILCETNLYRQGVSISGTLQMNVEQCPAASGKHVVNIHGAEDENLPVAGGHTTKGFNKKTNYKSQDYAAMVWEQSGASYDVILLEGADHSPETINAKLLETKGITLPQKIVEILKLDTRMGD